MARILKHAETRDVADDVDHPIPALNVIDVHTIRRGGGADLHLIIAQPLQDDRNSQERLLAKIGGYLDFIGSEAFMAEAGAPSPDTTQIVVIIHPESSAKVFELLERCKPWAEANQARLVVRSLDESIQ